MIVRTMTYTDYNGETRTEKFYFNLTAAEIAKLNFSEKGGLEESIKRCIKEGDTGKMVSLLEKIVLLSYGERSEDGRQFIKSEELSKAFSQTPAYSDLFMSFFTDENAATTFLDELIPSDMVSNIDKNKAKAEVEKIANEIPDASLN